MTSGKEWAQRIRDEVQKAIIGQDEVIERLLVALYHRLPIERKAEA